MCDQRDTFYFFNYLFFYKKFIFLSIAVTGWVGYYKTEFRKSKVPSLCRPVSLKGNGAGACSLISACVSVLDLVG